MACNATLTGAGATICNLMDGTGQGLGSFFTAIQDSLVEILVVLGVAGAAVALVVAVGSGLGDTIGRAFKRS